MSIPSISGGPPPPPTQPVAKHAAQPPSVTTPARVDLSAPVLGADGGTDRAAPESSKLAVQDAVQRANATIQALRSNLKFTVDEATGIDVVKFIDIKTDEVIRQIPSEEMLALARRLDELKGLLIKDKA